MTVYPKCSAINLVGRGARVALSRAASGFEFFATHPLLMLSQSANDLCVSLLVQESDAGELLRELHNILIEKDLDKKLEAEVFGLSWQELQQ